jgi:hypothetical protein
MMTEATDQAAAIHRYEDALASLLVHQRIGQQFDFDLQTQFHEISIDAEPYRDTPEYSDAVRRADRLATRQALARKAFKS